MQSTGAEGGPFIDQPEISVVIVPNYEGGGEKSWKGLSAHLMTLIQEGPPVNALFGCCQAKSVRHMDEGRTTYR